MKFSTLLLFSALTTAPAFAQQCGDTITTTVRLKADLDCSSYSGFSALSLRGNGILNGDGFKIISPNTSVGIYAEGETVRIRNVEIQGAASATGILGYNVVRLVVDRVKATGMNIGVDYFTEVDYDCDRLRVVDSNLSGNNYGAKVNSPQCEYFPRFVRTDLSNSYIYALNLSAKKLRIREIQGNNFDGSANGLMLNASESIVVEGLDLASAQVDGTQIYVYQSPSVRLTNVSLGNNQSEGLNIYDVESVILKNVSVENSGVGIKVANEQKVSSLKITDSETSGNGIGLLVTSFGSSKFSLVDISTRNVFADSVSVQNQ